MPTCCRCTVEPTLTLRDCMAGHPNADQAYKAGQAVSSKHPKVAGMFPAGSLPPGHTNVDTLLANPKAHPLPSWHDTLESMIKRRAAVSVQIAAWSGTTDYHSYCMRRQVVAFMFRGARHNPYVHRRPDHIFCMCNPGHRPPRCGPRVRGGSGRIQQTPQDSGNVPSGDNSARSSGRGCTAALAQGTPLAFLARQPRVPLDTQV